MRRYVAVLAVIGCVVTGCASASDVQAELDSGDGARAGDGNRGDRGDGDGRQSKAGQDDKSDRKQRHRRHKKRNKSRLEVRLRNVVGEIDHFSSPSNNIGCQISDEAVRCDIDKRRYDPPKKPKSCDLDYGNSFSVGRGEPELGCVGDTALGAPTTLSYGTSTRVGKYGCKSRRDGMRCYNLRTGRGFLVSQDVYEFY